MLEEGDSFEAHINDTMIAGAGLNDRRVVEHVVEHAPRGDRAADRARGALRERRMARFT